MKKLIPLIFLFFSAPLQSSPMAAVLQLAGQVELGKANYDVVLDVEFKTEKAHTIQYAGTAQLKSESGEQTLPMTLFVTKTKKPRVIISILMSGNADTEGLYLELVAEDTSSNLTQGNLLSADTELMWLIRSPYRDFSETTYITRDRGISQLEITEAH